MRFDFCTFAGHCGGKGGEIDITKRGGRNYEVNGGADSRVLGWRGRGAA